MAATDFVRLTCPACGGKQSVRGDVLVSASCTNAGMHRPEVMHGPDGKPYIAPPARSRPRRAV